MRGDLFSKSNGTLIPSCYWPVTERSAGFQGLSTGTEWLEGFEIMRGYPRQPLPPVTENGRPTWLEHHTQIGDHGEKGEAGTHNRTAFSSSKWDCGQGRELNRKKGLCSYLVKWSKPSCAEKGAPLLNCNPVMTQWFVPVHIERPCPSHHVWLEVWENDNVDGVGKWKRLIDFTFQLQTDSRSLFPTFSFQKQVFL